jgi:hypothetical protein
MEGCLAYHMSLTKAWIAMASFRCYQNGGKRMVFGFQPYQSFQNYGYKKNLDRRGKDRLHSIALRKNYG